MDGPRKQKQIRLTAFENEPLARMAEQRLKQEGIHCLVRSLGSGPGGWGMTTNLPHAIYVMETDHIRACDVLNLAPAEIAERDGLSDARVQRRSSPTLGILLIIAVAILIFGIYKVVIQDIIQ